MITNDLKLFEKKKQTEILLQLPSWYLTCRTEENQKRSQSEEFVSRLRFEQDTSRIYDWIFAACRSDYTEWSVRAINEYWHLKELEWRGFDLMWDSIDWGDGARAWRLCVQSPSRHTHRHKCLILLENKFLLDVTYVDGILKTFSCQNLYKLFFCLKMNIQTILGWW
jgi:hypothetical protein